MSEGAKIWTALLGILVLFTVVILYARHVTITRQESVINTPVVAHYTNYAYGISLRYPPEWEPAGGTSYDRYEGADGFFAISAGGTATSTLDRMVREQTSNHPIKPYGSEPTVQDLTIDGQPAKLVMPSADQDPALHNQAALIVKYPKPMNISSVPYAYFIFWADRAHIQDIGSTLTFLSK